MNPKTIAIVGGGQSAVMAAATLRQQGFGGELHLSSDEQHLPYERPPLSKAMLLDDNPQLQPILPANWWREHSVQLHLGVTVRTFGRQTHQSVLASGQSYPWDRLLIATGAAARPLPQLGRLGDHCFILRHAGDAECLRDNLLPGKSIVIVSVDTTGLELAASVTQRGCQVTVVEPASTAMGRSAPAPMRDYLPAHHQLAGVRILLNSTIEHVEAGECLSFTLRNGETLTADAVIYGIGIVANDILAREAGLETANGIIVDTVRTTSDPAIFAAGDVAIMRQADGSLICVESWESANFQAQVAVAAVLNQPQPAATPGWSWTDQCCDNLRFVDEMQGDSWLIRGNSDVQRTVWFNLQDDATIGAVTLNQGREIRLLRKWIQTKKKPPMAALADEAILLKSI